MSDWIAPLMWNQILFDNGTVQGVLVLINWFLLSDMLSFSEAHLRFSMMWNELHENWSCRCWNQSVGKSWRIVRSSSAGFFQPNSKRLTTIYGGWRNSWEQHAQLSSTPVSHMLWQQTLEPRNPGGLLWRASFSSILAGSKLPTIYGKGNLKTSSR